MSDTKIYPVAPSLILLLTDMYLADEIIRRHTDSIEEPVYNQILKQTPPLEKNILFMLLLSKKFCKCHLIGHSSFQKINSKVI